MYIANVLGKLIRQEYQSSNKYNLKEMLPEENVKTCRYSK